MNWPIRSFGELFTDVTAESPKVPQSDYLATGRIPIVDQGRAEVAGFTNSEQMAAAVRLPAILFGDHTRRFKFVTERFAVGADGVKILRPSGELDPRFAYWSLTQIDLPSAGYSRHFKFLKEARLAVPPLPEQRRIAAILDRVEAIRSKRQRTIGALAQFTTELFDSMFGSEDSPVIPLVDLLRSPLRNGVSPSTTGKVTGRVLTLSAITRGQFDPSAIKTAAFAQTIDESRTVTAGDFLICRGNGNRTLVGRGELVNVTMPGVAFPDTMIAAQLRQDLVVPEYVREVWGRLDVRRQLEASARTTNGTFKINQRALDAIHVPVPPIGLQSTFAQRLNAVRGLETLNGAHLTQLDDLFASVQHRAFRGSLAHGIERSVRGRLG